MTQRLEDIERLQVSISLEENTLEQLQAEIEGLEHASAAFHARYTQVVQPIVERLEAARTAMNEMGGYAGKPLLHDEASIMQRWNLDALGPVVKPQTAGVSLTRTIAIDATAHLSSDAQQFQLKQVYRQFVREFHPDLATDPGEQANRNQLLIIINDAYSQGDLTTLEMLSSQSKRISTAELWQMARVNQLEARLKQLTTRREELRLWRDTLLHSKLMEFKREVDNSQRQGRDLLRDIAADLEQEYRDYVVCLDQLRGLGRGAVGSGDSSLAVTAPVKPSLLVYLAIAGQRERMVIQLKAGEQIILGRVSSANSDLFLDLTSYDASGLGVSREHMALVNQGPKQAWQAVWIVDLGSTNGTFLNGQRLIPQIPRRVKDGDEIRLGKLRITVYYDGKAARFLEGVHLRSVHSKDAWTTNQQTWVEALKLALIYGWIPALGVNEMGYTADALVPKGDAHALAAALERALRHLPENAPRVAVQHLDAQRIQPPVWYFGGEAGRQKIADLIAFCRQGAFQIER